MAAAGRTAHALAFLLLALLFANAARADDIERITNFVSDVTVQPDGVLRVRETITVNAQGDDIVHGIKRDFPTISADGVHYGFDVVTVMRDGKPEPFDVSSIPNGREIRIGDAGTILEHGEHTYVIDYTTDRQIRFFPEFDELYWNVTGNDWRFEIAHAHATIHLPHGALIRQAALYTGAAGARGHDAEVHATGDGVMVFNTTAPLYTREGLTIAVGFSKGAVTPPSVSNRLFYLARDHASEAAVVVGSLVLVLYFTIAWLLVGRDPHSGPVVPLYAAPLGLTAGAVRFLARQGFDHKVFAASLVSLAVNHAITIKQDSDKDYVLTRIDADADVLPLESRLLRTLFVRRQNVTLNKTNRFEISLAIGELTKTLEDTYGDGYRVANTNWLWPGLAIVAATVLGVIFLADSPGWTVATMAWASLTIFAAAVFGFLDGALWRAAFTTGSSRTASAIFALVLLVPVIAFGSMTVSLLFFTFDTVPGVAICLLAVPVGVTVLFHRLLRRPTDKGAEAFRAIAGLKLFLSTAVADELKLTGAPDMTPDVFERFLPYAIALDCEDAWSKRFEAKVAQSYRPDWYTGASSTHDLTPALTASVGTALASAASSSMPSTSSFSSGSSSSSFSSGSSGGGFSGGGGGGGGGSGW